MCATLYALSRHVVLLLLRDYILEFVDEVALCAICLVEADGGSNWWPWFRS